MNKFAKPVLYGIGGAIIGWLAAAAITLVLAVVAGLLAVIQVSDLIALVVVLTLVAPLVPAYLIGSMISDARQSLTKKSAGGMAMIIALLFASIPIILIINWNFPFTLMTETLEQPAWVGTLMTGYSWLMVIISPLFAFALAAEISLKPAATDRA